MDPKILTLRAWWRDHFVVLFQPDVSTRTLVEYAATLNLWEMLTANPTLQAITSIDLANFRGKAIAYRSPSTVNKHLRHLNHLFGKAGPPGPGNRDAIGLVDRTPWVKPLRTLQHLPRPASLEAIRLMYHVSDNFMQDLLVVLYNTGSRITAVLNLLQSDVDVVGKSLRFRAAFDKRGVERRKPLSRYVLTRLVSRRRPAGAVFELRSSLRQFYRHWHVTQDAAGLIDEQRFTPHGLKRACATELSKIASPWAVRYMLDHAQSDVTGGHYVNPLDELRDVVERLPQPAWGERGACARMDE
jgi:integrase